MRASSENDEHKKIKIMEKCKHYVKIYINANMNSEKIELESKD